MIPLAYRLVTLLAHKTPLPRGKLATSLAGRRAASTRWVEWAFSNRTAGQLVWVHAASVGESLTAIPVINRLKAHNPSLQIAHSFTSPSYESWSGSIPADSSDYLPLDEPRTIADVFGALRPSLVVCSRGDLWPEMAFASVARQIPIAIISGTVRPGSRRLLRPARRALSPTYECISWLGAASDGDALRWSQLGVFENAIVVTGDTRHDQVLERVSNLQPVRALFQWARSRPVLVAGSTYARDEKLLLEAFSRVSVSAPGSCLILVPHDCSEHRISEVHNLARRAGLGVEVWSGGSQIPSTRCVIVNMTGVLTDIYATGRIAYVGGGFRRGGIHAVSEPAAFGIPVIVGPHFECSSDASLVVAAGGGEALPPQGGAEFLTRLWLNWLEQDQVRIAAGLKARSVLQEGASDVTVGALLQLLDLH